MCRGLVPFWDLKTALREAVTCLNTYKWERCSSGFLQSKDSSASQKVSIVMSKMRNSTDCHCEDDEENKKKLIISSVL